jgi:hypothetical protein
MRKFNNDLKKGFISISMVEFNPDGSLKLPGSVIKSKADNSLRMRNQRCITLSKEVVNFSAPKKCTLRILLSDAISDSRFIDNIYADFKGSAEVETRIRRIDDKNFEIDIETSFRRCTECTRLINEYKELLCGNVIEKKGSCTFDGRKTNFYDEDYFD